MPPELLSRGHRLRQRDVACARPTPTRPIFAVFARYHPALGEIPRRCQLPAPLPWAQKLCEVVYCILRGHLDGSFPAKSYKPPNFYDACLKMEKEPASFGRSVRIQLPRMLIALYEIRNNRDVGHVGGDVDPNRMDAVCVLHMAKWIMAELVGIFHGVKLAKASAMVEALSEREVSLIWDAGSVRRVLDNSLSGLEKTLVLLFGSAQPLSEAELVASLEHSKPSIYRRDVLRRAHAGRLIEYDENTKTVKISPLGIRQVENKILQKAQV